jgi:hypothetical protein
MRILVCGGRDYLDYLTLQKTLDGVVYDLGCPDEAVIIQGGAKGADFLAKVYAYCWGWGGLHCVEYPADWKTYGKGAGAIRNQQMLDEGKPDLVVAFPGGSGTADMVSRARKASVEVMVVG